MIKFMIGAKVLIDGVITPIESIQINRHDRFVFNGRIDYERIPLSIDNIPEGMSLKKDGDLFLISNLGYEYKIKYLDELAIILAGNRLLKK